MLKVIAPFPIESGIGRYAKAISQSLDAKLIVAKIKNVPHIDGTDYIIKDPRFKKLEMLKDLIFSKSLYTEDLKNDDHVIFASPDFFHVAKRVRRSIGVIHDLFAIKHRDLPLYYRIFLRYELSKVNNLDMIIVQSKYTKSEVEKYLDVHPDIEVIYPAVMLRRPNINKDLKKGLKKALANTFRFDPEKKLVLNVASPLKRKGLDRLDKIKQLMKDEIFLITVGNNHGDVSFKIIDDDTLTTLYMASDYYLTTSYDEGFDIPVIEAINFSTPVVASNIPVHKEIASIQDGVYLFDDIYDAVKLLSYNNLYVGELNKEFILETFRTKMSKITEEISIIK